MPYAGVLLLSTQGGEIESAVETERWVIVRVFLIAAGVMVVLSILLARSIGGPLRRLAGAADVVRRRIRSRVEIPDFSKRSDEVGHLSGSLREMTNTLYARIEAIESFAADVAHELKNPLTSLRSAVETLPLAKSEDARSRLLAVIQHDVRRLDRLISDISDASRLDADLQRQEAAPIDLRNLLTTVVTLANDVPRDDKVSITLAFERAPGAPASYVVPGHDSRLSQVVDNLLAQRTLVLAAGRRRACGLPAAQERGRDRSRRRRPRHPARCAFARVRALLYRPARRGLRPEFRARTFDLAPDRRSPWRPHLGREPHDPARTGRRAEGRRRPLRRPPARHVIHA